VKKTANISVINFIVFAPLISICIYAHNITPAPQKANRVSTVNLPVYPALFLAFPVQRVTKHFHAIICGMRGTYASVICGIYLTLR